MGHQERILHFRDYRPEAVELGRGLVTCEQDFRSRIIAGQPAQCLEGSVMRRGSDLSPPVTGPSWHKTDSPSLGFSVCKMRMTWA